MNLSELTLAELKQLLVQIPNEIKLREKKEKNAALEAIAALAAERGFNLHELIESAPLKKERAPVAVKYRHPANSELSWTGRGRQPKWVEEFIASGGSLEQLSV